MRRPLLAAAGAVAALLTSVALAPSAGAAPNHPVHGHRDVSVCSSAPAGYAHCDAVRRDAVDSAGEVVPEATPAAPAGLAPADLQSAYRLPGLAGRAGRTVAIVDAYDAPTAEADMGVYRAQFDLPACTSATGCFKKVSQTGSTSRGALPRADGGWAQEISLDLDMVSAACPTCKILLVEARSASFNDLATAVRYAATGSGVGGISNSYGGSGLTHAAIAKSDNQPGIAVTASTGDAGYEVGSAASFPSVIAVGGTSLVKDTSQRGWTEKAWAGAGSGCSTLNTKPEWQTAATGCDNKATADVSAVADPHTGVAVYDSYAYQGASGWLVFGGTSASSPIVASVYALGTTATGRATGAGNPAAHTWQTPGGLFDVTSGSNGTCTTAAWCTAGPGWDGPTGLGTPNGLSAF